MKIGILGGTFNPIHNGHLNIAFKIYKFLSLDKVLFMPNKIPPHKNLKNILNESIRFDMMRIALKKYEFFEIEDYELKKDGISYTYQSLEYLHKFYENDELFFIVGSDSFIDFDKWREIGRIFKISNIVVYLREDFHKHLIIKIREKYRKLYDGNIFLYFDKIIDISSTEIRKKLSNRGDVSDLIPKEVYEYIILNGFYKE